MYLLIAHVGGIGMLFIFKLFSGLEDPGYKLLFMVYLSFLAPAIVMLVYLYFAERPVFYSLTPARMRGRSGNTLKMILLGLLTGFALNLVSVLIAMGNGDVQLSFSEFDPVFLLAGLVIIGVQSGTEELIFRGYGLSVLTNRYNVVFACLFNSLMFVVVHLENNGVDIFSLVSIFVVGICFSVMTVRWIAFGFPPCFILHGITLKTYCLDFLIPELYVREA